MIEADGHAIRPSQENFRSESQYYTNRVPGLVMLTLSIGRSCIGDQSIKDQRDLRLAWSPRPSSLSVCWAISTFKRLSFIICTSRHLPGHIGITGGQICHPPVLFRNLPLFLPPTPGEQYWIHKEKFNIDIVFRLTGLLIYNNGLEQPIVNRLFHPPPVIGDFFH